MKFIKIILVSLALPMVMQAADKGRIRGFLCSCVCGTQVEDVVEPGSPELIEQPQLSEQELRVKKAKKYLATPRGQAARRLAINTNNSVQIEREVVEARILQHKTPTLYSPSAQAAVAGRLTFTQAAHVVEAEELAAAAVADDSIHPPVHSMSLAVGEQLRVVHKKGDVERSRSGVKNRRTMQRLKERVHEDTASVDTFNSDHSPSPRPEEDEPSKHIHVITFEAPSELFRITSRESMALLPGIPGDQESTLGSYMPQKPLSLPGQPTEPEPA